MLELKNIVVNVADNKTILNNVSLKINDDQFVVITGPNGSGKSTLAKVIAGIQTPTSGQILLNGEDITNLNITERAKRGLTFAFQQPVRFKGITVRDMLIIAAGDSTVTDQELSSYLYSVGLCAKDYIEREIDDSLSGGEIKRIEIAMAIARRTGLTIFDEPEAGIDIWSFNNLTSVFSKMQQDNKGSIVVISHQERIFAIADEIIVLSDGVVRIKGSREEILPQLLACENQCEFCSGGFKE